MGKILKPVSKISGIYGQPGEERVSQFLAENLSDQYVILNSPRLFYHGATYDIDHIVIGPNGIFVIETKNMQGTILGGMMGNWVQERNRTGRHRKVKIGNPANQANHYSKVVRSYLGSRVAYETGRKINFRIYPIVVFVHDEIDLSRMDYTKPGMIGRVKVLKLNDIVDFISTREGGSHLTEDIEQFAGLLVPEDQRDQTTYFSMDMLQEFTDKKSGRYEILEEIGRGNFGVVFRAFDYKMDEEIAIKKLPRQNQNSPNAVNRFYREAQIASALQHENIVSVYDYYEKSGEHYIVMEMVEGQTLEEYVKSNVISVDESLRIMSDVCRALSYAHEKHVIHRDLKPSNILISSSGEIKVTDFGIAKLTSSTDLTLDGTGAGTPVSMAPEQITGGAVTEKSDIFALGNLLYYLTTGRMPFDGEHLGEIVHRIAHLNPVPPRHLNAQITPDLEAVILKALEKSPEDRFDNVSVLLQTLEELTESGHMTLRINRKRWLKYIPAVLRPTFRSERKLFAFITVTSLIIFIGILGYQVYRDSRQLVQEAVLTKQYGFNNENLRLLFDNPKLYMGLPVNLVGRVDKIIRVNENNTQFSVIINPNGGPENRNIIVSYYKPNFSLQFTSYIKITGSLQNTVRTPENEQTPIVIADKVEAIADPWSILAPSQFTVYPNNTVRQNSKVVHLEKVEFAEQETRLFVRLRNEGNSDDILVLAHPLGEQGTKEFREMSGSYRTALPPTIQLQPYQEARAIVFLEPLNRKKNYAAIVLGSSNDILMGQQPYTFNITW